MLQTLSNYVDIEDESIRNMIKELKILEIQIPQDQQIELVKQIFEDQKAKPVQNQKYQVQIGNQYDLNLIEEHFNKPLLCEYLESQYTALIELISDISKSISEISLRIDQKQSASNKQQVYKFQEEAQTQILSLNQPLDHSSLTSNNKDIYKNEMVQFIKDQKNNIVYQQQVSQLELKVKQTRKIIFEKIEEQNNLSDQVVQKMEMNIDNELKLLEKTIELKFVAKVESDLQQEVLKMEKSNANITFNKDAPQFQDSDQIDKQVNQLFNQICQTFQDIKEQKVKNNDLIYDQILNNIESQSKNLNKVCQQHESNTYQLQDYINNYSDSQQQIRHHQIEKIKEQKRDYEFCQSFLVEQQSDEGAEIDEFLKQAQNYNSVLKVTEQMANDYNVQIEGQKQQLELIKQYLLRLQKLL
ncbi:unnamed protein product (macronuclear) [Paramecium tetraurelia]|uniref:Uncharacterized protein n=1 Tax=Paramecium tetraurelia TaxID=5888 RepID=A0BZF9_PARTE|nr:uncharacterized protein GSPATT00033779001 [Paramecium tetraurelia]CAK63926.1 unnamed protein product [Paramecium tetraurelia]|eukprot:XP_001431324.1 hypothetical protein (macronuclear) [Paramecium tetraurelia strain d4-2]